MQLKEFVPNVFQWARDRNLHTADPAKQVLKLVEEAGEAGLAWAAWESTLNHEQQISLENEMADGIGDSAVVLCVMGSQLGMSHDAIVTHPAWENKNGERNAIPFNAYDFNSQLLGMCSKIAGHIARGRHDDARKWVVDGLLLLSNCALDVELDFEMCLAGAWNEIKDRQGYTFNGVFIKQADLKASQLAYVSYVRSLPEGESVQSYGQFCFHHGYQD